MFLKHGVRTVIVLVVMSLFLHVNIEKKIAECGFSFHEPTFHELEGA